MSRALRCRVAIHTANLERLGASGAWGSACASQAGTWGEGWPARRVPVSGAPRVLAFASVECGCRRQAANRKPAPSISRLWLGGNGLGLTGAPRTRSAPRPGRGCLGGRARLPRIECMSPATGWNVARIDGHRLEGERGVGPLFMDNSHHGDAKETPAAPSCPQSGSCPGRAARCGGRSAASVDTIQIA